MVFKNLFRRKGRTILTLVGIAIGVAAIVALGAMADGLRAGYTAMARGSQADLVLTEKSAMDMSVTKISWTPGFSREVPPLKRGVRPSSQLILVRPYGYYPGRCGGVGRRATAGLAGGGRSGRDADGQREGRGCPLLLHLRLLPPGVRHRAFQNRGGGEPGPGAGSAREAAHPGAGRGTEYGQKSGRCLPPPPGRTSRCR